MRTLFILLGLTLTIIVLAKNMDLSSKLATVQKNIHFKTCLESAYSQDQIDLCTKLHAN